MRGLEYIRDFNYVELLKEQWQELLRSITPKTEQEIEAIKIRKDNLEMVRLVNRAKYDWKESQNYFENVSHPDLIDLAIYRMEAAKVFYMYLLKEAKEKGTRA